MRISLIWRLSDDPWFETVLPLQIAPEISQFATKSSTIVFCSYIYIYSCSCSHCYFPKPSYQRLLFRNAGWHQDMDDHIENGSDVVDQQTYRNSPQLWHQNIAKLIAKSTNYFHPNVTNPQRIVFPRIMPWSVPTIPETWSPPVKISVHVGRLTSRSMNDIWMIWPISDLGSSTNRWIHPSWT